MIVNYAATMMKQNADQIMIKADEKRMKHQRIVDWLNKKSAIENKDDHTDISLDSIKHFISKQREVRRVEKGAGLLVISAWTKKGLEGIAA